MRAYVLVSVFVVLFVICVRMSVDECLSVDEWRSTTPTPLFHRAHCLKPVQTTTTSVARSSNQRRARRDHFADDRLADTRQCPSVNIFMVVELLAVVLARVQINGSGKESD